MIRKNLLFALVMLALTVFSGCRSTFTAPPLAVSLLPAPPASVEVKLSTPLSATVTSDPQAGGVDWSVTCGSADCGSFSAAHTASNVNSTYTAPATVPTGGTVTVTAASVDSTNGASASATITITPVASAATLVGQYAFYFGGYDASFANYAAAGSLTLDGAGGITGEEDFNDASLGATSVADTVTGTYSVGDDGRGSITLNAFTGGLPDTNVGVAGVQTLSIAVVNNNHILIEEFDASATSRGSLDLQTASAFNVASLTGGYSFFLAGSTAGTPYVLGGVVVADGAGNFNSTDSVDQGFLGSLPILGDSFLGSIAGAAIDASGRGELDYGGRAFAIYVIGPEAFRIVDIDATSFPVVGSAFGQGAGSGSFSAASLTGTFVVDGDGQSIFGPHSLAGSVTTDGTSALAGVIDYDEAGIVPPVPPAPDSIPSGSYLVAASGYGSAAVTVTGNSDITTFGVYVTDPALNLFDPNNASGATGGALLLELDVNAISAGVAVPQTATSATAGNLAMNVNGDAAIYGPFDIVGQVLSDGSSSFSGAGDENQLFVAGQLPGVSLTGTLAADGTNPGRYTGTLDINGVITPSGIVFYQVSSGDAVHIQVDPIVVGVGTSEQQQ